MKRFGFFLGLIINDLKNIMIMKISLVEKEIPENIENAGMRPVASISPPAKIPPGEKYKIKKNAIQK